MNESYDAIQYFANDVMLRGQFFELLRGASRDTPDRALWYAVLEDAVMVYLAEPAHWASGVINKRIKLAHEAREWIWSDDIAPGSYLWICDALSTEAVPIDATWLREGLLKARQAHLQPKLRASPRRQTFRLGVARTRKRRLAR